MDTITITFPRDCVPDLFTALETLGASEAAGPIRFALVEALMGGKEVKAQPKDPIPYPPKRKPMSAAARKRISRAQKARWAEYHKNNK